MRKRSAVVEFAVSHKLPLTVFVFNDNAVGQERHDLVHKGLPTKYAEVAQPDFEKLAVGFGAEGFRSIGTISARLTRL